MEQGGGERRGVDWTQRRAESEKWFVLLHHERQSSTICRNRAGPVWIKRDRVFRPPRSIYKHMQAVQWGCIAGGKVGLSRTV